ncbi:MAG: OFA family MFS transporter [Phycisphaerales bacterium]|nr:MAG: OFA family MFS transporter [Phycisphaerales bacterium]
MTTVGSPALVVEASRSGAAKWFVMIGAIMVQLILGTVYGYSVFWQPLDTTLYPPVYSQAEAAGLRANGDVVSAEATILASSEDVQNEHAARQAYLKYSFAICLLMFSAAMVFAGRVQDVKGPRFTAIVGAVILAVGFLIAGQLQKWFPGDSRSTLFGLWASIGVLAGVGIGFAYVCPIAALVKWFPAHKGLVSGIAVAGFGLGAYIFSGKSEIGAVGFIEKHGISTFFSVHGLVCLIAVTFGGLLLRNPPASASAVGKAGASAPARDSTWQELLRSGRFYVVWLMFFSGAMAGLMVIGILKPFAGNQLVKAAEVGGTALLEQVRADLLLEGAAAVGVLAIFNAVGRVVWGFVSDRIGRTLAMILMFCLQGVTLLVLAGLNSKLALSVGAACVGFNFGGNFALFPSLTADLFGAKNLGANYGWVFTSYGVAGVIGVAAGNLAYSRTGSYFVAFVLAAILCFLSALLALALKRAGAKRVPA